MKYNQTLADSKGLSDKARARLDYLYESLDKVLNNPAAASNQVDFIEETEYALQKVWGFPPDRKFHRY